jgi:hypothetical protein
MPSVHLLSRGGVLTRRCGTRYHNVPERVLDGDIHSSKGDRRGERLPSLRVNSRPVGVYRLYGTLADCNLSVWHDLTSSYRVPNYTVTISVARNDVAAHERSYAVTVSIACNQVATYERSYAITVTVTGYLVQHRGLYDPTKAECGSQGT